MSLGERCPSCELGSLRLGNYSRTFYGILLYGLECWHCDTCKASPIFPDQVRRNQARIAAARNLQFPDRSKYSTECRMPAPKDLDPQSIAAVNESLRRAFNNKAPEAEALVFSSVTDELWREYTFAGNHKVRIELPVGLHVTKKGAMGDSHRILSQDGHSHYIPAGWVHLEWLVKSGKTPFAF